jgi:hypothetical protein
LLDAANRNVQRSFNADVTPIKKLIAEGCDLKLDVLPAVQVAAAEVDLRRVRRVRHDIIAGAYANPDYRSPTMGNASPREFWGPEKLAQIQFDYAAKLAVIDRYERRALSRRKFAIRDFDEIRAERAKTAAP